MTAIIQRSFAAGEIAPSLYARVDTAKYATGLRTCRNFLVARHGGAFNRPGTRFVAEVNDSATAVRLIPFVFNAEQTYVLEFGNLYMRVYRLGGQIVEAAQTITAITQANPAVVTITGHGYSNGDEVFLANIGGMVEIIQRFGTNFKIANVTANTFELQDMSVTNVDSSGFTAFTSGGTAARVFQITTPYATADLPDLRFVQSADVITIVHPSHAPRTLSRTGHAAWTLAAITFAPTIAAPTGEGVAGGTGTGFDFAYVVTTIATDTLEESLVSGTATLVNVAAPAAANPNVVTWTQVSGAQEYNIYRQKAVPTGTTGDGIFGFLGTAADSTTPTFNDDGSVTPDFADTPPISRNPFPGANDFPSTVTFYQQRRLFANTNNNPERVFGSKIGNFANFTISSPLQADDAITFDLAGRQVNEIEHLIEVGILLALTRGAEWTIGGDEAGTLTATSINTRQQSYNGSSGLAPLIINGSVLYTQARGSIVRDLGFDVAVDGYRGSDLTIFSSHLFDEFTFVDWTYQQIPQSIVWMVRSDGTLLGLTYIREHQLWAWHRHDFQGGVVENVVSIPSGTTATPAGNEDDLYLVVRRTINSRSVRYIERMATRQVSNIVDSIFMDSALSLDGRNTNTSHTMTLSGGTNWDFTETLTLTSSAAFFVSTDVGNEIHLTGSDGTIIRFSIDAFTSDTVVTGRPNKTVPAVMRSVAISTWSRAVDQITGLFHLEGQNLSVFGDGFVVASPNNAANVIRTVVNGSVTLDKPYAVIHAGLPYLSDLETLDIDVLQIETLADKNKLITHLSLFLEESRGIFAGTRPPTDDTTDPLEGLTELKIRNDESTDLPVALQTGTVDIQIRGEWNSNGRVFVRQVDPIPLAVLAVVPAGLLPIGQ